MCLSTAAPRLRPTLRRAPRRVGKRPVPEPPDDRDGVFALSPSEEEELLESIAEADRGETVSAAELLQRLQR